MKWHSLICTLLAGALLLSACTPDGQSDSGISIHTNFEAGNLGPVTQVSPTHWRCAVAGETDSERRNRQASWYYFRVEGAKGRNLAIDLTDLTGEYNYRPGAHAITAHTRPVISYDQKQWRHLSDEELVWDEAKVELYLKLRPARDTVWIAHMAPYTTADLYRLLDDFANHPRLGMRNIGRTAGGRPIHLLSLTNPDVPLAQKRVIWLMARQHAWEAGTSYVMEGLIRYLLRAGDSAALLDRFLFQLIPMADPDGVVRGGVRFNAFGHDLNRNWDRVLPAEMPEIQAQKQVLVEWVSEGKAVDVFLSLHNTESADYLQGPDLPAGHRLWEAMAANSSFESTEGLRQMPATTTEGKAGRMTVYQALWAEHRLPAYLMEMKVEKVAKLDRSRSVQDWLELGPVLAQALAAAVE